MYTDDKATQLLVALLKEYNIKNVVISPGTRNYGFAESIQQDDFFTAYSVIDERSAAYFATGIAFETGEPVVIVCTGQPQLSFGNDGSLLPPSADYCGDLRPRLRLSV